MWNDLATDHDSSIVIHIKSWPFVDAPIEYKQLIWTKGIYRNSPNSSPTYPINVYKKVDDFWDVHTMPAVRQVKNHLAKEQVVQIRSTSFHPPNKCCLQWRQLPSPTASSGERAIWITRYRNWGSLLIAISVFFWRMKSTWIELRGSLLGAERRRSARQPVVEWAQFAACWSFWAFIVANWLGLHSGWCMCA